MFNAECSGRIADMTYFHLVDLILFILFFLSVVEMDNEIFIHRIQNLQFLK